MKSGKRKIIKTKQTVHFDFVQIVVSSGTCNDRLISNIYRFNAKKFYQKDNFFIFGNK